MLNMGFQQDIEQIFCRVSEMRNTKTQNLLFSATIPNWIWAISRKYQTPNCTYIDLVQDSQVQTSKTVTHYRLQVRKYER